MAFDAGNLGKVARSIRGLFPEALIVLCADDDGAKHSGSGRNPGADAAAEAARAMRGHVALPKPLPEGGTDFNDLAQALGGQAVAQCVADAVQTAAPAGAAREPERGEPEGDPGSEDAAAGQAAEDDNFAEIDGFLCAASYSRGADGKHRKTWQRLCRPLEVLARVRDPEGNGWGRLLQFRDPKGAMRRLVLPDAKLSAERAEWPAMLADKGFDPPMDAAGKKKLAEYIRTRHGTKFAKTVQRIGWHDESVFVLHDGTAIGEAEEPYLYPREGADAGAKRRADLAVWRSSVAALSAGNSRLAFAVSCAFAGVLLDLYQLIPGMGFHLFGESGKGKSTCMLAAASVWGGDRYMMPWRATDSALESICAQRCDTFLPLDELKQVEPGALAQAVYMMGNGAGKARSNQGGANRPQHTWRVAWLSNGEMRTEERIKESMQKQRYYAGQEVRMPDIPADAGAGLGAFEVLHGHSAAGEFAKAVGAAAHAAHGTAGPAFVGYAVHHRPELAGTIRSRVAALAERMTPEGAADGVRRAAERFALVALAGELASEAGITGWPPGEAERAASRCMGAWIEARGGIESGEDVQALRQVQSILRASQRSRFILWSRILDTRAPNVANALGYLRLIGGTTGKPIEHEGHFAREAGDLNGKLSEEQAEETEAQFVILPDAWKGELCAGFNAEQVRRLLHDRGYLVTDPGRNTLQLRIPGTGGQEQRCTVVKASILGAEL